MINKADGKCAISFIDITKHSFNVNYLVLVGKVNVLSACTFDLYI